MSQKTGLFHSIHLSWWSHDYKLKALVILSCFNARYRVPLGGEQVIESNLSQGFEVCHTIVLISMEEEDFADK